MGPTSSLLGLCPRWEPPAPFRPQGLAIGARLSPAKPPSRVPVERLTPQGSAGILVSGQGEGAAVSPSALLAWKVALRAGVSPSLPSLACPSSARALPPPTQLAARPRLGCPCVSSLLTPRLPSVLLRPPGRTTPLSGGAGLVGTTGHTRGTSRGCAQRWIYFRVTRTEPSVKWTGFIAKHRLPQFPREADPRRAPLRRRPRRGPAAC